VSDRHPLLIGLTGNICTGKSTVANMLIDLGAEVIDADKVAHEVMRASTPAHRAIVETFGPGVLGPDGEIDRKRLGALVFADPAALARLEAIVHPVTLEAIHRRVDAVSASVVVVEAIKLIEAGMADVCDSVWVTTCRPDQQVHRLVGGRGLSPAEARQRVEAQSPQEEKIARADVIVDTSGSLSWTRAQVRWAWEHLTKGNSAQRRNGRHGTGAGNRRAAG
jgi:dephospho-CoA kinase